MPVEDGRMIEKLDMLELYIIALGYRHKLDGNNLACSARGIVWNDPFAKLVAQHIAYDGQAARFWRGVL